MQAWLQENCPYWRYAYVLRPNTERWPHHRVQHRVPIVLDARKKRPRSNCSFVLKGFLWMKENSNYIKDIQKNKITECLCFCFSAVKIAEFLKNKACLVQLVENKKQQIYGHHHELPRSIKLHCLKICILEVNAEKKRKGKRVSWPLQVMSHPKYFALIPFCFYQFHLSKPNENTSDIETGNYCCQILALDEMYSLNIAAYISLHFFSSYSDVCK